MALATSKSSDELVSRLLLCTSCFSIWNHRNDPIKKNSLRPLQCSALPYTFQDWKLKFSDLQTDRTSYMIDSCEHRFVPQKISDSFCR